MTPRERFAGRAQRPLAGVAALFAAGVIAGWLFDVERLAHPFGVSGPTKLMTAICLVALALAVVAPPRLRRVAAAVALVLAGQALIEWVTGIDFGLDDLITPERAWASGAHVSRVSPLSAVGIVALAAALLMSVGARRRQAEWPAIAAGAVGIVSVVGYAYGIIDTDTPIGSSPIALATALLLLGLSIATLGIVGERVEQFLTGTGPGSTAARRILLPAFVGLPLLGWVRIYGARHGWFEENFGVALLIVTFLIVIAAGADPARAPARPRGGGLRRRARPARRGARRGDRAGDHRDRPRRQHHASGARAPSGCWATARPRWSARARA